ncbi:transport and Golgi organization protein 6 homolog isoform X2 [Electrophorus electricus]|uniref:transport and Golgi organization protein 6 homolog isoform X2 n=1 Tax=Electrophorus electricus TaxID=8005 RepID=UPI0015CF9533|nr:transport and Golgi organization protein 6 homolog isoform X2 [Electrophorus electricus]
MTTSLLTALSILIKPIRETHLGGVTPQEALLSALQRNQVELQERLAAVELEEARCLLEEVRGEVPWFCADTEDLTWRFVQECLLLLLCLARHLSRLLEAFSQSQTGPAPAKPHPPETAPPLPPDVLSVAQQKTLGSGLQFLVTLGLCPYLSLGVGVSLGLRSAFGAAVKGAVRCDAPPPCERRLLTTVMVLLEVSAVSSLATLVFTRHLGDLMAALCQLGYCPQRPEGEVTDSSKGLTVEERKSCRQALQGLLGRVYQPIVIKELLALQGGAKAGTGAGVALTRAPPWLRCLCGQLLSERLVQPHGVQAVVRAILEGAGGGDSDWRKCDAVAKVLATCPQQCSSAESYYSQVCPQVLELLHFKDKITAQQFQRVATRAALTIVQDQPEFGRRFLLSPLFAALCRCAAVPDSVRVAGDDVSQHAVPELELTRCVEDVYKICVVGNTPSAVLLSTLGDVVPIIFSLFCFTKQNVSHLRAPCQEILLWYLSHTETSSALSLLNDLCVTQRDGGGVTSGFQFSPSSEGGATFTRQQPIGDEDDALYEKVFGEQWRVGCVVQLLAEMKDSDLPGDFFLSLLHALTEWAGEEQETDEDVDAALMTLLELEQRLERRGQGRGQKLALLHTLAVMCAELPHTLLLRKASQVVGFVGSMLQRACVGLDRGSEGTVDSQTLGMGMGLVATLLSGAAQLTVEDYSSMTELLVPLEQVSQRHPEAAVQELAYDLRASIATRGAYHPGSVTSAARTLSRPAGSDVHRTRQASPTPAHTTFCSISPRAVPEVAASGPPLTRHTAATDQTRDPASRDGECSGTMAAGISTPSPVSSAPEKVFSDWLQEACDPDVPTRTMALRALTQAVREGLKRAIESQEQLLMLFLENLEHEDSFVYLSAIQGLVVLADSFPEQILTRLLAEYQANPSTASASRGRSLETRLKVGEALMRASRAMGDLAPHYGRPLVGAFLRGTRDEDSSVRASCLSNLGELCQLLHFSLGPLAQELSVCLTALIKTERDVEVRRAAVYVIALLLRGLSDRAPQVLEDILLELYRALKWVVRSDSDEVAVLQAQLALEELDSVMRRFIFPQQKLEKKIVVLP